MQEYFLEQYSTQGAVQLFSSILVPVLKVSLILYSCRNISLNSTGTQGAVPVQLFSSADILLTVSLIPVYEGMLTRTVHREQYGGSSTDVVQYTGTEGFPNICRNISSNSTEGAVMYFAYPGEIHKYLIEVSSTRYRDYIRLFILLKPYRQTVRGKNDALSYVICLHLL
jgi:hypothetical protein